MTAKKNAGIRDSTSGDRPSVISLVLAAGSGLRLTGDVPKGFRSLGGSPMFLHSLATFDRTDSVHRHVLVVPEGREEEARIALRGAISKPVQIVTGGKRRQDSVLRGLQAAARIEKACLVAVHDAARPFVGVDLIERTVAAAWASGAAVAAVPVTDTVREVGAGAAQPKLIDRRDLRLAQTPQTARLDWLLEAYERAGGESLPVTDEGAALQGAGFDFSLVEGSGSNFKITTTEDLSMAEAIVAARRCATDRMRVGFGEDRHARAPERPFVLAGVVLDPKNGPAGHSDGDPLCHALIDALLGAAGEGSIGDLFPDTEERWSGAAGLDLLARAMERLTVRGWRVVNVDAVILADAPRMSPHVPEIRRRLAAVLGVGEERVSFKGKRAEGLGFEGSGGGVSCRAIVLIEAAP